MPRVFASVPVALTLSSVVAAAALLLTTSHASAAGTPAASGKGTTKPASTAGSTTAPSAAPAPSPTPPPPPPPVAEAPAPPAPEAAPPAKAETPPPAPAVDLHDPTEISGKRYYYLGLRYRGTILPQFLVNAFVDGGGTIFSNSIGLELDMHKDNFSFIPSISYADYNSGDMVFLEKGKDANLIGNYTVVNSSLKTLYLSVDLLWDVPVSKGIEFEYGVGLGAGVVFGDLENNWVKYDANGNLTDKNGKKMSRCVKGDNAPGCSAGDHSNSKEIKTGGYKEKFWLDGGSAPSFLPNLSIPQVGMRFHPIKEFEGRVGIGWSPYGFFFQLSGNYGLPIGEADPKATAPKK
jgi:hypothetical protein